MKSKVKEIPEKNKSVEQARTVADTHNDGIASNCKPSCFIKAESPSDCRQASVLNDKRIN